MTKINGKANTLNGAIRYFAYAIRKPNVVRAPKKEKASYCCVSGRYRTSRARMAIDATWSMKPAKTAARAGRKNVCFFLRAVRTECAKPREYRPSASLSRTTCMAAIIAHGSEPPPCAIIKVYRNDNRHIRWYCPVHRSSTLAEHSRIGTRMDRGSFRRSHGAIFGPRLIESDSSCRSHGHDCFSFDWNICAAWRHVRLGQACPCERLAAEASVPRPYGGRGCRPTQ